MLKLTRILTATGLGLTMGLSLLTSGAFAQSANQKTTRSATYTTGVHSIAGNWQRGITHGAIPNPHGKLHSHPHHGKNIHLMHKHGHNNHHGRHNRHPNTPRNPVHK